MSMLPWEPFQKHPAHAPKSRYGSAGEANTPGDCADGRALDPSAKTPVRGSEFYTFGGTANRGLGEGGPPLRVSTKKLPLLSWIFQETLKVPLWTIRDKLSAEASPRTQGDWRGWE